MTGFILLAAGVLPADEIKVSLSVKDLPAQEALAKLQAQVPEIPLLATSQTLSNVTVDVSEVSLDKALQALAESLKGSRLRVYLLTPQDGPQPQWSADELAPRLTAAREKWYQQLPPELRRDWDERAQAEVQARLDSARQNPPLTGPLARPGVSLRQMIDTDDPLRQLALRPRWETITLGLTAVPLADTLSDIALETGYLALADETLSGEITADFKDLPVGEALAQVAKAVGAKLHTVYLLSEPVKLSEAEVQQKLDREFQREWGRFWQRDPQERQRLIGQAVERIKSVPPAFVGVIKQEPRVRQMFDRLMDANTQLSADQRRELKPLMQEIIRVMHN
jgi:hypothetical protein